MKNKIAFIKSGTFSHINASVRRQIARLFPDFEIVDFEVRNIVRSNFLFALSNFVNMLNTYGATKLVKRADPIDCFIQTPACFAFLRDWFHRNIPTNAFAFTFQTQSMWDASVPGIPNFVYTDYTELTSLQQVGFDSNKLLGDWWQPLEREIYQHAEIVFTMSSNVRRSAIEDYGCTEGKVRCVFAGSNVDLPKHTAINLARYQRQAILFVGVKWERKGGPELLSAFEQVAGKYPDATLTIAGCNPPIKMKNCLVLGRLKLESVAELYEEASMFCLPTRHEPFGIAFIEAMHHGLPVIGTNHGAIPDFIDNGENGYLVPTGDIDALVNALHRMLSNPQERQRMGQQSLNRARKHYTWDQVGQKLFEAISDVAELNNYF